jgi:hypothetical protein
MGDIAAITRQMAGSRTDHHMNRHAEELFTAITSLAHAPATNGKDLAAKLEVLCRRLREFVNPDQRGEVLTVLLAESIRDEVSVLVNSAGSSSQRGAAARRGYTRSS